MASNEERQRFGQRLRELRLAHDWSLDQLCDQLRQVGEDTTAANIGAWERGQYAPRHRTTVAALEALLDAPGRLAPLLGIVTPAAPDLGPSYELPAGLARKLRDATPEERARVEAYLDGLLDQRDR